MSLLNQPIPSYVNRCAYIASFFSCLFPRTEHEDEEIPIRRFQGEANHLNSSNHTIVDVHKIAVINHRKSCKDKYVYKN